MAVANSRTPDPTFPYTGRHVVSNIYDRLAVPPCVGGLLARQTFGGRMRNPATAVGTIVGVAVSLVASPFIIGYEVCQAVRPQRNRRQNIGLES